MVLNLEFLNLWFVVGWWLVTPALGESTDRQTELEIILQHSIPRVYTSPSLEKESERSLGTSWPQ